MTDTAPTTTATTTTAAATTTTEEPVSTTAAPRQPADVTFTTADGLLADNVTAITEDPDGVLWAGSPVGLTRIDPTRTVLTPEVLVGGSAAGDSVLVLATLQGEQTEIVDNLPLLVHDIVIIDQVLANLKVVSLDFFLGTFYGFGNHAMLNSLPFGNIEFVHDK